MAKIPSIAMIPSGYKATKVYSVLPTDGNGDLTFARSGTANRVASNGLIEEMAANVPRLDYSDGTCPSLLLEPQSTNQITYSEEFDNGAWSKSELSVTANSAISLDGTTNADLLIPSTNNVSNHHTGFAFGSAPAINDYFTLSFYVKKAGYESVTINVAASRIYATFSLTSKTVAVVSSNGTDATNESATITEISNGWFRITLSGQALTTSLNYCRIVVNETEGVWGSLGETFAGDGVSGIYAWGGQFELLRYATSYIPTSGATATRIADSCSKSGLGSYINSSEGVLYVEMSALANDGTTRAISLDNGGTSVGVLIRFRPTTNEFQFLLKDGVNPDVGNTLILSDATQFNKFAIKWKNNDIALWVNGIEELISISTLNISGLSDISFSNFGNFHGKVKELKVYDSILSDAELQTLTTL